MSAASNSENREFHRQKNDVFRRAIDDKRLTHFQRIVLWLVLDVFWTRHYRAFVSNAKLAERLEATERAVREALSMLERVGYLCRRVMGRGRGLANERGLGTEFDRAVEAAAKVVDSTEHTQKNRNVGSGFRGQKPERRFRENRNLGSAQTERVKRKERRVRVSTVGPRGAKSTPRTQLGNTTRVSQPPSNLASQIPSPPLGAAPPSAVLDDEPVPVPPRPPKLVWSAVDASEGSGRSPSTPHREKSMGGALNGRARPIDGAQETLPGIPPPPTAPRPFPANYALTSEDRAYARERAKWDDKRMADEVKDCAAWCGKRGELTANLSMTWRWWVGNGAKIDADKVAKVERERQRTDGPWREVRNGII